MFWLAFQTPTKPRRNEPPANDAATPCATGDNVKAVESSREQRIRERAYQIWLNEGRPQGRDLDHWRQAEIEILDEGGSDR